MIRLALFIVIQSIIISLACVAAVNIVLGVY